METVSYDIMFCLQGKCNLIPIGMVDSVNAVGEWIMLFRPIYFIRNILEVLEFRLDNFC